MRAHACVLAAMAILAAACSGDGPAGLDIWAETTVAYDPSQCPQACTELDRFEPTHIKNATARVMVQPGVDDPTAQWLNCVLSFVDCAEQGADLEACVAAARCPEPCKQAIAAHSADPLVAFEAVVMTPDGLCAVPEGQP